MLHIQWYSPYVEKMNFHNIKDALKERSCSPAEKIIFSAGEQILCFL